MEDGKLAMPGLADEGRECLLLPPSEAMADEKGVKKTVCYRFHDDGRKVKITSTYIVRVVGRVRRSKADVERRGWEKFGDACDDDDSARLTVLSHEDIRLERPRSTPDSATGYGGTYVPPKRESVPYSPGHAAKASVRVGNWSTDADEIDLEELFGNIGPLHDVWIAKNLKTGTSKGTAIVNFLYKADAERAIALLDGYGYDHRILQVSWA